MPNRLVHLDESFDLCSPVSFMSSKPHTDSLGEFLLRHRTSTTEQPLGLALAQGLRDAIHQGVVSPGHRLPASRDLAQQLGVARNTLVSVYAQLQAEGFVVAGQGSGTYVRKVVQEHVRGMSGPRVGATPVSAPQLSRRGQRYRADQVHRFWVPRPFCPGLFNEDLFPHAHWNKLLTQLLRTPDATQLRNGPPGGLPALRAAIARHVHATRGVRCEPSQVVVTDGTAQSLTLIGRLLCDFGDQVWVEDPCYWVASRSLADMGLTLQSLPVDEDGARVPPDAGEAAHPRLAYLTPSHQFPTGAVMSLARRQAWLAYARTHGTLLLEDDYDSEFRYNGPPVPSLQGMDADAGEGHCVIYLSSFSKTMFPGIRLGFMVLPPTLAELFATAGADFDRDGDQLLQAAMAAFMDGGHYAAHVRKLRQAYGERREALVQALHAHVPALAQADSPMRVRGGWRGVHLTLGLPAQVDDREVAAACAAVGVTVIPLSAYALSAQVSGLVLSYAGVPVSDIEPLVARIAPVLRAQGQS
jgi:GntR family transcriptional regulator/MocR family aminotransferase